MLSGLSAKKNPSDPLTDLTVLTWNVWFDEVQYRRRMEYILNLTIEKSPDVACFQEVLQEFADMIFKHPIVNELYHVSPFTSGGYGVLTMVKKEYNPQFSFITFPTRMGRELLKASLEKEHHHIVVGNVHLESLDSEHLRAEQLRICARELNKEAFPILVGDFNFCSERNFHNAPGAPLENGILKSTIPDFQDLWKLQIRNFPISTPIVEDTDQSTPKKGKLDLNEVHLGYTFDSAVNPMIRQHERMRYDRIMAKLGSKYCLVEMKILGTEPIDAHEVNMIRSSSVTGLWPSDHFGLLAQLRSREPLTLSVDSPTTSSSQGSSAPPNRRPSHPFSSAIVSPPSLKHVEGTIVTQRDGTRVLEKIDKVTGAIRRESLTSANTTCQSCGTDLGFQLEKNSEDVKCEDCKFKANLSLDLPAQLYLPIDEIEQRVVSFLSRAVSQNQIRLLAIDYDATICQVHTYGRWTGSSGSLAAHTRPVFRSLLKLASTFPSLRLAVVTFSGQSKLIREVLRSCMGSEAADRVFIRGADGGWSIPPNIPSMDGKQPHIASVMQEIYFESGEMITPQQVILIDDDRKNIDLAKKYSFKTVLFPPLPLPGIHLRSQPEASGVKVHRRYPLLHGTLLCISEGSVVNFRGYEHGAIVNAANSGGVTGGGVDGAVSAAGGEQLMEARLSLPIIPGTRADRIPCGDCRATGPKKFGNLQVPTVIHAVGPNYCLIEGIMRGEGKDHIESLQQGDSLLTSAYLSSMKSAKERRIELLGFSLLSSGVFRGSRTLEQVLRIALTTLSGAVYEGLREVHLIAFTDEELNTLIDIAEGRNGPIPPPLLLGPGSAEKIRQFMMDLESALD